MWIPRSAREPEMLPLKRRLPRSRNVYVQDRRGSRKCSRLHLRWKRMDSNGGCRSQRRKADSKHITYQKDGATDAETGEGEEEEPKAAEFTNIYTPGEAELKAKEECSRKSAGGQ